MNWKCKWFGHKKIKIEDRENYSNLAYCKRCMTLHKWDILKPMFYRSTGRMMIMNNLDG